MGSVEPTPERIEQLVAGRDDDGPVVQYPSRRAFLETIAREDYRAAAPHRTAALEDSRSIACRTLAGPNAA